MPVPVYIFSLSYNLQDGLLQLIAKFGRRNYCFIHNASMLGTVFNHAIANLKITYTHNAIMKLSYPNVLNLTKLRVCIGKAAPKKWGRHYLLSLLMAYQYQKCFLLKDPGT